MKMLDADSCAHLYRIKDVWMSKAIHAYFYIPSYLHNLDFFAGNK
jgi:hypothetical protein